jgi:predicted helicase
MHLMEDYKKEPVTLERLKERNSKVVNDDYVKFLRFAQEVLKSEAHAIVAYVMPHSYTDNLTFRGMRWCLLQEFDAIYILDLHGNVMSRESTTFDERDENIFDIQQGVCVSFFIKDGSRVGEDALIFYADKFGSREAKYNFLQSTSFSDIDWTPIKPVAPHYFFKPKDLSLAGVYNTGIRLSDLFPTYIGGIKTHSDATLVSKTTFDTGYDQLYDYRPFDVQHINYDLTKVERHRNEVMKHFVGHWNIGLVMDRQVVTDNWSHIHITHNMIDNRVHYSRKGIPVECPLLIYNEKNVASPNVDKAYIPVFEEVTGLTFSDALTDEENYFDVLDLFDYCYGILNSQAYRDKYKSLLSIDFPRVPVPTSLDFFDGIVSLGRELRKLHMFESVVDNVLEISFIGDGDRVVSSLRYDPTQERVFINRAQHFSNVRPELWGFYFGGYNGLQKWFKEKGIPFGTAIIHIKRRPKRVPESFGTLLGRLTSTFNILERRLRAY